MIALLPLYPSTGHTRAGPWHSLRRHLCGFVPLRSANHEEKQNFTDKDTWHETHGKIFEELLQKAETLLGSVTAALGSAWGGTYQEPLTIPFLCSLSQTLLSPSQKLNDVSFPPKLLLLRQGKNSCHPLDLAQAEVYCAKGVCKLLWCVQVSLETC